jgi:hypothetical protein
MHNHRRTLPLLALLVPLLGLAACGSPSHQSSARPGANPSAAVRPTSTLTTRSAVPHPPARPAAAPARAAQHRTSDLTDLRDVAWTSRRTGWLLDQRLCPIGRCAGLLQTIDGGHRWRRVRIPRIRIRLPSSLRLVFTPAGAGYIYNNGGRGLWSTTDGGRTWQSEVRQPIAALTLDGDRAYRIAYRRSGCPGPCNPVIQAAPAGTIRWHTIDRHPDSIGDGGLIAAAGADIAVAMVGNPAGGGIGQADYVLSTNGGATWHERSDPCGRHGGKEFDTSAIAMAQPGDLVVACDERSSDPGSVVAVSTDAGATFVNRRPDRLIYPADIAAGPDGEIAIDAWLQTTSTTITYTLETSDDYGRHWHRAVTDAQRTPNLHSYRGRVSIAADGSGAWIDGPSGLWISNGRGHRWHSRPVRERVSY